MLSQPKQIFYHRKFKSSATEHSRSHEFGKGVTMITIIEQIKRINMTIERRKEILRARERLWQGRLNTVLPNGLNKRMGYNSEANMYFNRVFSAVITFKNVSYRGHSTIRPKECDSSIRTLLPVATNQRGTWGFAVLRWWCFFLFFFEVVNKISICGVCGDLKSYGVRWSQGQKKKYLSPLKDGLIMS